MDIFNEFLMLFISASNKIFVGMLLLYGTKKIRTNKVLFYVSLVVCMVVCSVLMRYVPFLKSDFVVFGWFNVTPLFYLSVAFLFYLFFMETTVKECLLNLAGSMTIQHLTHHLGSIARCLLDIDKFSLEYKIIYAAVSVASYVFWYFFAIRRYVNNFEDFPQKSLFVYFTSITVLAVFINQYAVLMPGMDNVVYHTVTLFLCVTLLLIMLRTFDITKSESENRIMTALVGNMQKKYKYSQMETDMINRKYHDINRMLAAVSAMDGSEEQKRTIEKLREELQVYSVKIQTGNNILDTFLLEKYMTCKNNDINFSFMLNGEDFNFVDPVDIYCLFGNLLDNAIEYLVSVNEKNNRIVTMSAKKQANSLVCTIENYVEKQVELVNGQPKTAKSDSAMHGFGIKSAEYIANKYGGKVVMDSKPHRFVATVYLFDGQ